MHFPILVIQSIATYAFYRQTDELYFRIRIPNIVKTNVNIEFARYLPARFWTNQKKAEIYTFRFVCYEVTSQSYVQKAISFVFVIDSSQIAVNNR